MRQPNGYGSVVKLSGKRRKPFMVRITVAKEYSEKLQDFVYRREVLGYYSKREDALKALAAYNDAPYDLIASKTTFSQMWEKHLSKTSVSSSRAEGYAAAYKYCSSLHNLYVRDISTKDLQLVIDACPKGSSTKSNIRYVMNAVFQEAILYNIITKNPVEPISIARDKTKLQRIPFTDKEIALLWERKNEWMYALFLILLYSGMRISELIKNVPENVDLENRTIYVPESLAKTQSSIRFVPIHEDIVPLVRTFLDRSTDLFITKDNGYPVQYQNFMDRDIPLLEEYLGVRHTPHDTRHTFITQGFKCNLKELALQKIVGHAPQNITHRVYTHVEQDELRNEINKIHY